MCYTVGTAKAEVGSSARFAGYEARGRLRTCPSGGLDSGSMILRRNQQDW